MFCSFDLSMSLWRDLRAAASRTLRLSSSNLLDPRSARSPRLSLSLAKTINIKSFVMKREKTKIKKVLNLCGDYFLLSDPPHKITKIISCGFSKSHRKISIPHCCQLKCFKSLKVCEQSWCSSFYKMYKDISTSKLNSTVFKCLNKQSFRKPIELSQLN